MAFGVYTWTIASFLPHVVSSGLQNTLCGGLDKYFLLPCLSCNSGCYTIPLPSTHIHIYNVKCFFPFVSTAEKIRILLSFLHHPLVVSAFSYNNVSVCVSESEIPPQHSFLCTAGLQWATKTLMLLALALPIVLQQSRDHTFSYNMLLTFQSWNWKFKLAYSAPNLCIYHYKFCARFFRDLFRVIYVNKYLLSNFIALIMTLLAEQELKMCSENGK